jgi:hypothetical protein
MTVPATLGIGVQQRRWSAQYTAVPPSGMSAADVDTDRLSASEDRVGLG